MSNVCKIEGNSDMYGLGIRLGIYMQWFSTILSNALLKTPSKERGFLNIVLVYNVALLAVIFILFDKEGSNVYAIEFFPVFLFICNGYLTAFGFVLSTEDIKTIYFDGILAALGIYGVVTQIIMPVALLYFSWFWIWGFPHAFKQAPCGNSIFLFAHLHDGGVTAARVVYGIISVLFGALTALILSLYLFVFPDLLFDSIVRPLTGRPFSSILADSRPLRWAFDKQKTVLRVPRSWLFGKTGLLYNPDEPRERRNIENLFKSGKVYIKDLPRFPPVAIGFITTIYSILAIELTLHWNNVTGVYTLSNTGQLIPFVIGIMGMIQSLAGIASVFTSKETATGQEGPTTPSSTVYEYDTNSPAVQKILGPTRRQPVSNPRYTVHTGVLLRSLGGLYMSSGSTDEY